MNKLDIAVGIGVAITINLIYELIFQLFEFVKFFVFITVNKLDVCYFEKLRSLILMLLTIIVLTNLIKSAVLKINKNFKYKIKSNVLYIVLTLVVIKSKVLFEFVIDLSSSFYATLNIIIVILLMLLFIVLLKKSNSTKNEFIENFIIILKTIIVMSILPIIHFIIKIDFSTFDYFLKNIVEINKIELTYTITLLIVVAVASVLYKSNSDKEGLVEHVLVLSIFFAVIPTLIGDIYKIIIIVVDFVKLASQVDRAFDLVSGDLRLALFYSIPSIIISACSVYIINKNYYQKSNE